MASSEDSGELLHNAAIHQGLYCLRRQTTFNTIFSEIITLDPSIQVNSIDHPAFSYVVCSFMENNIGLKRAILMFQTMVLLVVYNNNSKAIMVIRTAVSIPLQNTIFKLLLIGKTFRDRFHTLASNVISCHIYWVTCIL